MDDVRLSFSRPAVGYDRGRHEPVAMNPTPPEPEPKPRGRPSQGAREAILEAALDLFMQRDYADVSTAEIIERAGVSKGALYHHFPGKLDLFLAVHEDGETALVGKLAAAAGQADGPFAAVVAGARAYLRECETNERLRRIGLTQSRAVLGWERWRESAAQLGLGAMRAGVEVAIDAGEMKRLDPETTAVVLLGTLIEAAMLIVAAEDRRAARKRSEAVVLELLGGLRRG
jgi:AcrR family transcriptional regulator